MAERDKQVLLFQLIPVICTASKHTADWMNLCYYYLQFNGIVLDNVTDKDVLNH